MSSNSSIDDLSYLKSRLTDFIYALLINTSWETDLDGFIWGGGSVPYNADNSAGQWCSDKLISA